MTTLKPQLVRADTLDLQDHEAPSAKDHTRQPQHPAPYGYGPAAPHQAQTLRHASEESYNQQRTSPRVSEDQGRSTAYSSEQRFYDDPDDDVEDEHMNHLHGLNGSQNQDHEYEDADASDSHDEDMDDDLMDKISSSPSIEDGKYTLPKWTERPDTLDGGVYPAPLSTPPRGYVPSSPPSLVKPIHFMIPLREESDAALSSHLDEEPITLQAICAPNNAVTPCHSDDTGIGIQFQTNMEQTINYLLPLGDPCVLSASQNADEGFFDDDEAWEDEDVNMPEYKSSSDDTEDPFFTHDTRFVDSGWGGECLRELEDIDFEFVYALHTFVATVEGQANATKGDTMVLLDDTNSYWWLVRVVKDGSIGYLPAEHIETPTERLARLNKHRNIDLSASMLGDNPEKSKNPLKKAMRRRNAKTVQFAAPTYYEPSEYDYSEEEDADDSQLDRHGSGAQGEDSEQAEAQRLDQSNAHAHDERIAGSTANANGVQRMASVESLNDDEPASALTTEPDIRQAPVSHQDPVSRSRRGVVRNTDSFFKDDTAETKKISLTPRLLRGDSDNGGSTEQQEVRQRLGDETFDKMLGSEDKQKEQPKKEKKGMLSGLFKRKEKSAKVQSAQERPDKTSEESMRHSPQSKDSLESLTKMDQTPERKPSKLHKNPPVVVPSKASPTEGKASQQVQDQQYNAAPPAPSGPAPKPPAAQQIEQHAEVVREQPQGNAETLAQQALQAPGRFPSLQEKRSALSATTNAVQSASASTMEGEPGNMSGYSRSNARSAINAIDLETDQRQDARELDHSLSSLPDIQASHQRNDSGMQNSLAGPNNDDREIHDDGHESTLVEDVPDRDSESKVVTPTQQTIDETQIETEHTASTSKPSPSTATTHTPSTSRSTPTWSDASLRTYMENDQDIKDLLIIVHDKSNVVPVSADHPLMANLFSSERNKLAELQFQLDNLLIGWMSRKSTTL